MLLIVIFHQVNELLLLHVLRQFELGVVVHELFVGEGNVDVLEALDETLVVDLDCPLLVLFSLREEVIVFKHTFEICPGEELLPFLQFLQGSHHVSPDISWPSHHQPHQHFIEQFVCVTLK